MEEWLLLNSLFHWGIIVVGRNECLLKTRTETNNANILHVWYLDSKIGAC